MAEVYWIHLPEHTDVFTQGYVGVTKNTAQIRFNGHVQAAKSEKGKNYRITNVINKYGKDNLVVDTLVICEEDYAYELEAKLRPTTHIGWNIAVGGEKSGNYGGYKLTEETRQKMSKSRTGVKLSEEWCNNISKANKGKKRSPLSEDSVRKREETRFYNNFYTYPETWGKADIYYSDFLEGLSSHYSCKRHGVKSGRLNNLFNIFAEGWNPCEDLRWMEMKTDKDKQHEFT